MEGRDQCAGARGHPISSEARLHFLRASGIGKSSGCEEPYLMRLARTVAVAGMLPGGLCVAQNADGPLCDSCDYTSGSSQGDQAGECSSGTKTWLKQRSSRYGSIDREAPRMIADHRSGSLDGAKLLAFPGASSPLQVLSEGYHRRSPIIRSISHIWKTPG